METLAELSGFVQATGLVAIVVAVTAVARRKGLLAPTLLMFVGLCLSLIPGFPAIEIEPHVVLVGVLPPLLYVAALEMSVPAVRLNLRPILLLAVGLVAFTAAAVGLVVHALLPDVPLAICFALGAVVAPPDAIAATAIAKRIGLPRRIVTILEGESLLNDATALVLFRVTVAAAIGEAAGPLGVASDFVLAAGGGILIGAIGAVAMGFLHRRTQDPLLDNTLSLLTPFGVALVSEALHVSAVVAVVVTGLYLGHRMPTLMSAASRLQMDAFWRMVQFLLEGLVFLVVGLQLFELSRNLGESRMRVALLAGAVLLTVIVVRPLWVFPATYLPRLIPAIRRVDPPPPPSAPAVISWAGMRGVVTLATALALPAALADGREYPRDLFIFIAFVVIVGTLLIQGLTLPAWARLWKPPPDDPTQDVLAEAAVQHAASRAARERLEDLAADAPPDVVDQLRRLTERRTNAAWERLGGSETPSAAYARLRMAMLEAEREVFRVARDEGRIAESVLLRAQRELDLEESLLERKVTE